MDWWSNEVLDQWNLNTPIVHRSKTPLLHPFCC
jgi:hypothetical protein